MHRSWQQQPEPSCKLVSLLGGDHRNSNYSHTSVHTTVHSCRMIVSSIRDGVISRPRYYHSPNSSVWKNVKELSFCLTYSSLPEVPLHSANSREEHGCCHFPSCSPKALVIGLLRGVGCQGWGSDGGAQSAGSGAISCHSRGAQPGQ